MALNSSDLFSQVNKPNCHVWLPFSHRFPHLDRHYLLKIPPQSLPFKPSQPSRFLFFLLHRKPRGGSSSSRKMEGLIPIVYKAIKRTRTRSRYECLSSGAAQNYSVSDFHDRAHSMPESHLCPDSDRKGGDAATGGRFRSGHRRYKSVGDFSFSRDDHDFSWGTRSKQERQQQQQQLVRFGSHRMFSCITGAT